MSGFGATEFLLPKLIIFFITGHDVDDVELNSPQDPISNDHPTKNKSRVGSDDESDVELVSSIAESDNVSAEPKPLLDDVFLDRYFQQQYEVDSMQDEPGSSNTENRSNVKKTPLEPCSCVVYQCTHWFTEDWRLKIYSRYAMLPPAKQVQFLQDHTKQIPKKVRHRSMEVIIDFSNELFILLSACQNGLFKAHLQSALFYTNDSRSNQGLQSDVPKHISDK